MANTLRLVEDESECDEPPPLERLVDSLKSVREALPGIRFEVNEYDNSVSVLLMFKQYNSAKGYGGHEVFRIYDPEKEVSERNVADGKKFIADSMKHPNCYRKIRQTLESLGYQHFHNSHSDYLEKRFKECLSAKGL